MTLKSFTRTVCAALLGAIASAPLSALADARAALDRFLDAPFEQWIVADGEHLWVYDPELRQATVRPVETALEATPLALLTQPHRLDEHFAVEEEPVAEGWRLVLRPWTGDADFTRLEVDLGPDADLIGLAFMDIFGQRTEIRLKETRRNPPLAPAEFQFTPPPGTDVYRP
jgi:outer membrane lipoprotein carrier protein